MNVRFTFLKAVLMIVILACAPQLKAQVTFTNMGSLLQPISGTSYADLASDMNSDGLDDVVRVMSNGIYIDYQQANGTFTGAFYEMSIQNLPSWSICAADIDNNGFNDILLGAGNAVSFVYANDTGTGYTEDAHPEYIFTQRSTFADIDNDGNLDSFCNHDVDQCHPYRNVNGVLELDFSLIETLDAGGNYAAIWVDYDNDWDSDLYITKCRGGASWGDPQRINLLYRNNGDGTFTEVGAEANMNDGNQSWTTAFEDFDNDGDFDAFTVNHSSGDVPGGAYNKFMINNGDGTFTDIIGTTGINASDLGAWNCDAADFDNNGYQDIFSEMSTEMYWNNGNNSFTGSQLTGFNSGGIGDFNNDGFLDVISGNSLWMNDGNNNNYIKFNLQGIESNKSAIGARVEIYGDFGMKVVEIRSGESFDPGSTLSAHFGLGTSTAVSQVVVKWPSGTVTTVQNPEINQTHPLIEAGCVAAPITISASGSTTICPGQSVTLSAPAGDSYIWNNGGDSQSIEVSTSGSFNVIMFDNNNCAAVSNNIVVEVIEEENPTVSINGEEVFCEGSSVILTSTAAQSYTWSNGQSGQSVVITESGDYFVNVEGQCSGVEYQSNVVSINVLNTELPIANNVTIGEPGTANLIAVGENLNWYATETSTEVLGTGNTFTTEYFDNTISYWVESVTVYGGEEMSGGKPDNTGGGGLPATGGNLIFSVSEAFTLEQVTAYIPDGGVAGTRTINLYDAGGNVIATATADLVIGTNVIDLDFEVPVGTGLQIGCTENNLFRNNAGLTYPYAIGDVGSITSSTNGSGYYYYFYDWKIKKQETSCVSDRIEVSASVVGIDEVSNPLGIGLYPNPAAEVLNITCPAELNRAELRITDATGRLVISRTVNMSGRNNFTLDLNDLASGLYHLQVVSGGKTSSLDFVKE